MPPSTLTIESTLWVSKHIHSPQWCQGWRMDAWSTAALSIPDETLAGRHWLSHAYTAGSETVIQALRWPHAALHHGVPLLLSKDLPSSQMGNRPPKQMEVRESRVEIRVCTETFQSGVKLAFGSSPPSAVLGFHICQFSLQTEWQF